MIDEEAGSVYYKQIIAQTTRGTVTADDTVFDALAGGAGLPQGYASDEMTSLTNTVNHTLTYNIALAGVPIRPFTVSGSVYISAAVGTVTFTDDGAGKIVGYKCYGTIVYSTGDVALTTIDDPDTGSDTISITYQQDMAGAADIPKIIMKLATKPVKANVFALKDTIGLADEIRVAA